MTPPGPDANADLNAEADANANANADPAAQADALDRACLHATALRDRAAFERLYRRHHLRLLRFLRRFSTRRELIDEVVNDAMWVVWRRAAEFRGDSKVSTWITGIAYRCMLKALRGGAPADELSESALAAADRQQWAHSPIHPDAERELRDWVAQGLRTLPDDLRTTIELAYGVGLSCDEIAGLMGCAAGTVKARLFHARVRLRNVLPALGGQAARAPGAAGVATG